MARPNKRGLDYFPMDTSFFDDMKIQVLFTDTKGEGVFIWMLLLTHIYRNNGYFMPWSKSECTVLANHSHLARERVEEIVGLCIEAGLFDFHKYKDFKILTSAGIQRRYIKALERRKVLYLREPFMLINLDAEASNCKVSQKWEIQNQDGYRTRDIEITVNRTDVNVHNNVDTADSNKSSVGGNQQSKGKKSKAKESKEKDSILGEGERVKLDLIPKKIQEQNQKELQTVVSVVAQNKHMRRTTSLVRTEEVIARVSEQDVLGALFASPISGTPDADLIELVARRGNPRHAMQLLQDKLNGAT